MPSPSINGTLSVAGQTLQAPCGQMGVGQPGDVTAIVSMTGVYTSAQIAVEGLPAGQPITQPTTPGPQMGLPGPGAVTTSEWIGIEELGISNGQLVSSPVTLTSAGGPSSGFAYTFPVAMFVAIRLRLISIGSGQVVGGLAFMPFPLSTGLQQLGNAINQLELSRIRLGMSILLEGDGINLQDITASDFSNFV